MSRSSDPGFLEAVAIDLQELHAIWMSLVFPRQREGRHSVLGRWRPETTMGRIWYTLWSAIGTPLLAILYPLAVLGFGIRYYAHRMDRVAASIGILGVVAVSILAWGALTAAAYFSRISFDGLVAVAAAGLVATVSAALAVVFSRIGGRVTTVVFAYPFGVTALFLPPVVAALYSPTLADVVFTRSDSIAIWILDNILDYGGINTIIRESFDLEGLAYVGMWFGLAVPIGWFLGIVVALANLVRPTAESESSGSSDVT